MKKLYFPKNYSAKLNVLETEIAVKKIKDFFQKELSNKLNLTRVSAPLFVFPETGLNDGLNGYERAVKFDVPGIEGKEAEIVHSLAKWKRHALYRYDFKMEEGLYTDMNAIRRDEELDNLHSIYVDQWDWEKIIPKEERKLEKLKKVVCDIYDVFKKTEEMIKACYEDIQIQLPQEIFFISSQELEDMYPDLSPKEREDKICREKKAVFLMGIGEVLNSGEKHDGRAPDYDDWKLNGDILFWNPTLGCAFELSSMGIRVDAKSLKEQLAKCRSLERLEREYHSMIMDEVLPHTIGGGIGQSRICMFFLNKAHIGEVQASLWPDSMKKECADRGIELL